MTPDQFDDLVRAEQRTFAGPELLPVRLARAAVAILQVDGAGISVLSNPGMRVPIGASDPMAAAAERLQFTVGEGPCLLAHATGQPVFATSEFFEHRWPVLYAQYTEATPFRAVVSLPLRRRLTGIGAIDLHLKDPTRVLDTDWTASHAIADRIAAHLGNATDEWVDSGVGGTDMGGLGMGGLGMSGLDLTDTGLRDGGVNDGSVNDSGVNDGSPATASGETNLSWLDGPAARGREQVWLAIGMASVHLGLPAPDALAALRGLAYTRGQDIDELAADLAQRRLPLTELSRR